MREGGPWVAGIIWSVESRERESSRRDAGLLEAAGARSASCLIKIISHLRSPGASPFPHVFSPWPGRLRASGCPPIGTPETRMVLIGVLADAPWPFPSVSHRRLPSFPRSLASPTPNGPSHTPQCGHSVPHHPHIPLTLMALTAHHMIHTAPPPRPRVTQDEREDDRPRSLLLPTVQWRTEHPPTYSTTTQSTPLHMPLPAHPVRAPSRVPIHFAPSGSPPSHLCPLPEPPSSMRRCRPLAARTPI